MLRNGCNYWNVILGIRRIQQRVEATCPGRHFARQRQQGAHNCHHAKHTGDQCLEEHIKVLLGHSGAQIVNKGVYLAKAKNAKCLRGMIKKRRLVRHHIVAKWTYGYDLHQLVFEVYSCMFHTLPIKNYKSNHH